MRLLFFQFILTNGVWKWATQKSGLDMSVAGSSNVVNWAAATMRHKFLASAVKEVIFYKIFAFVVGEK